MKGEPRANATLQLRTCPARPFATIRHLAAGPRWREDGEHGHRRVRPDEPTLDSAISTTPAAGGEEPLSPEPPLFPPTAWMRLCTITRIMHYRTSKRDSRAPDHDSTRRRAGRRCGVLCDGLSLTGRSGRCTIRTSHDLARSGLHSLTGIFFALLYQRQRPLQLRPQHLVAAQLHATPVPGSLTPCEPDYEAPDCPPGQLHLAEQPMYYYA